MKKLRLLIVCLLILALMLAGCGKKTGEPAVSDVQGGPAFVNGSSTSSTSDDKDEKEGTDKSKDDGQADDTASDDTAEENGDIVILFTSDIHCGIDQGFGLAGLAQIRQSIEADGTKTILVDNGDAIQGEPIGTMTTGEAIIDLMNKAGYDIAIPGNHEFDYGMDRFLELVTKSEHPYISCNFNKEGELVFDPYVIKEIGAKKIAFVGVTTPESLKKSTPKYFQDENGNYIYGFMQSNDGQDLYNSVQNAIDSAKADGADLVVVMGHIGMDEDSHPYNASDIIENTSGIDVFLDGHSHDTEQIEAQDKDGNAVVRLACGTKLNGIGWVKIANEDNELSYGLYSWNNDDAVPDLLGIQNDMYYAVKAETDNLNDKLKEVVAHSDVELTVNDPEEKDSNGEPVRMIRRAETNLGDLCADAYRDQSGADIAFVNGGGVRASIPEGDITLGDILKVHPFGNMLCMINVSGQQILDALEWGASKVPNESGGFLQVSGITFEIDLSIDSPVKADDNGMYAGISGKRRVKNVMVGDEPIDPKKTYKLASHNYMLKNNGDGYTMFDGCELLLDEVMLDNQVLINYITGTLNGTVGEEYSDPRGAGRIKETE